MERNWISLTPLRLDLTDEQQIGVMHVRHPLDESLAVAVSPPTPSPEAAKTVRDDEAAHAMTKSVDEAVVTRRAGD
jgi:hypothetical protein